MQAYLYAKKGVDLTLFIGDNPENFFKVVRGSPGGLGACPGLEWKSDLLFMDIKNRYWDPETEQYVDLAYNTAPPLITYTPPGGNEPVSVSPRREWHAVVNQDRLDALNQAKAAEEAAANALKYREDRKRAYVEQIGPDSDIINTIGDTLDIVIKRLIDLEHVIKTVYNPVKNQDWDDLLAKIESVKQQFPK